MSAYNGYPMGGQPNYLQQYQQAFAPRQATGNIIWVQGEAGAKSYIVAPGMTVLLMDSEGDKFYIKSTDASGMPMPLRVFEHKEITAKETAPAAEGNTYATKDDLAALRAEIEALKKAPTSHVSDGGAE